MLHFHLITIFPDVCRAYTDASVLGRAQKTDKGKGAKVRGRKITVSYYNPREYTNGKHKKVDDKPYGGGPGMVMKAEPIIKAWQAAVGRKRTAQIKTLITSPRGRVFDQAMAKELAEQYEHIVLIAGRYEGIDSRVAAALDAEYVSVGDYVLTGGELPALAIVDATARHVQGVLGESESLEESRATTGEAYTRPEVIEWKKKKIAVPKVFVAGNHKEIEKRRAKQ
jgi:tRNA (guanine37-N1)-methyltransferase